MQATRFNAQGPCIACVAAGKCTKRLIMQVVICTADRDGLNGGSVCISKSVGGCHSPVVVLVDPASAQHSSVLLKGKLSKHCRAWKVDGWSTCFTRALLPAFALYTPEWQAEQAVQCLEGNCWSNCFTFAVLLCSCLYRCLLTCTLNRHTANTGQPEDSKGITLQPRRAWLARSRPEFCS